MIPPRVWIAFTNWYGKSKEIRRYVIQYPYDKSTTPTGLLEDRTQNNLKIVDKDVVYELEIDLIYVKIGALSEDGKP